jgi:hypothetical protein
VESLQRELGKSAAATPASFAAPAVSGRQGIKRMIPTAEEEYFQLLVNHPTLPVVSLEPGDFSLERDRRLMEILLEQRAAGKISPAALADELEEQHREWLLSLSTEDREYSEPPLREAQLAADIRLKRRREKLVELTQRIKSGAATSQEAADYRDILKQVKGSQPRIG